MVVRNRKHFFSYSGRMKNEEEEEEEENLPQTTVE